MSSQTTLIAWACTCAIAVGIEIATSQTLAQKIGGSLACIGAVTFLYYAL